MKKSLGEKLSPLLNEIANILWESEEMHSEQPNYTKDGFESAIKIFMSVMMDKIWNLQQDEDMTMEDRINMVTKCGSDVRDLVKTYTNIDTHEMYKDHL